MNESHVNTSFNPTDVAATAPGAADRALSIFNSPGPYLSIYLACGEFAQNDALQVFEDHRAMLSDGGVSDIALAAAAARLALPAPQHSGGRSVHVASDGSTVADFALEGPSVPLVRLDALPRLGPLFEWQQWRVPHVTVEIGDDAAEIITFLPNAEPAIHASTGDAHAISEDCRRLAIVQGLRLIAFGGNSVTALDVANRVTGMVPPETRVITMDPNTSPEPEPFSSFVVRHVSDVVARDTVQILEDFRFLRAGGRTVEGTRDVLNAMSLGEGQMLLIHDDPDDERPASFGTDPHEVSSDTGAFPNRARLVDVAIWSAVSRGMPVRIVPTTAQNGPSENIGLMLEPSAAPVSA